MKILAAAISLHGLSRRNCQFTCILFAPFRKLHQIHMIFRRNISSVRGLACCFYASICVNWSDSLIESNLHAMTHRQTAGSQQNALFELEIIANHEL